ncbi:MAG TPA: hypothetical protein VNG33_21775, partial [Polyangiaceae bacterium]|nr:hypothetical protein [Polyangiaceae bacterium]
MISKQRLRRTFSLGAVGAALCLVNCSKLIGLQDGKTQGPCTTDAECAPGYQCSIGTCSPCAGADQCNTDVPSTSAGRGGVSSGTAGSSAKGGGGGLAATGPGEGGAAAGETSTPGGTT